MTTDRDRQIFDAGFAACRSYGDNHFHFHGAQADKVFASAMMRINAKYLSPAASIAAADEAAKLREDNTRLRSELSRADKESDDLDTALRKLCEPVLGYDGAWGKSGVNADPIPGIEGVVAATIAALESELKMWKPMTPEEAEAAYEAAESVPISDDEINAIVSKVTDPLYRPSEPEHVLMAARIRQLESQVKELKQRHSGGNY